MSTGPDSSPRRPSDPAPYEVLNEPARTPGRPDMPTGIREMLQAGPTRPPTPTAQTPAAPTTDENDVRALLRESTRRAESQGAFALPTKPRRRSRRTKDYWLVLTVVDGFLLFAALGPFSDIVTRIFGLAGVIVFTTSFTWVMFQVMDDY